MHPKQSAIGVLLALLLGCVFAVLALFIALFGADAYSSVLEDGAQNDMTRTATLYIANKVRRHDGAGCVSLGCIEDSMALVLSKKIDDAMVSTYLYLYEGNLCEVSVLENTPVKKMAGQPVLPLSALSFSLPDEGLLTVAMADGNGHDASITLYLRTAEVKP